VDGNFSCKAKEYVCRNPQPSHWNNGKKDLLLQPAVLTSMLAYFLPEVDPEEVKLDVAPPPECPDIKASEYADSTAHHKHLRYSGIMGSVCKHHSFYKMVNISSRGEKYIFARKILETMNREPWAETVIFKYDIWCNFLPYLRNRDFIRIPGIACIPIGHSLTHIIKCQYKFFPWLVPGNGLSSGEEVETGWSKLRYLWSKIREMGIGTREDAISDALEHINRLMLEELPEILLRQLDRVTSAETLAQTDLAELRRLFPDAPLSDAELDNIDLGTFGNVITVEWQARYVRFILELRHLTYEAETCDPDTPEFTQLQVKIRKINKTIEDYERKQGINRYGEAQIARWKDAGLGEWLRDIKDKLRTNLVLENHYRERSATYRKCGRSIYEVSAK